MEIFTAAKNLDERLYYIRACAKAPWTVEQLQQHLRADDYHHIGALPNNFGKTLSPMALATKAVRSFRDEYLLELVNLDNADAVHDQDVDERVLSKALVADVEKTIQALGAAGFGCGCAAVAFVATDGRCSALADLGFSALGFFGPCCCTLAVLGFSWPRPIHHHTPPAIAATTTAAATHLAVVRLLSPAAPTWEGRAPSRPLLLPPSLIPVGAIPRLRHSATHSARFAASTRSSRNAPSLARYVTVNVIVADPPATSDGQL